MKYQTKRAMFIKGDRVARGQEVELTKEEAAPFLAHLIPAGEAEAASEPAPAPAEEKSLEDMSAAELKEKAAELGLSTSGTKADLQERITLHLEGGGEEEEGLSDDNDQ